MIEFDRGQLFMKDLNNSNYIKLADGIPYMEDIEISDKEEYPINFNFESNKNAEFSYEIASVDLDLIEAMCHFDDKRHDFTLRYNRPIMIQARWHKRNRINKKWIKRYGFKPDTILVTCDSNILKQDMQDGSFNFEIRNMKYYLKPHQKRRNLKIEW